MSARKKKSMWLQRLDELRSLSLEPIAAEINTRRLKELREQSTDRIVKLPTDRRVSAKLMQRTLIALHEILANNREWIVSMESIGEQMSGASESTARRGILALETAFLISVTRITRIGRNGGQGENQYMIVWSTIKDIAMTQGLQPSLFDDEPTGANQSAQVTSASVTQGTSRSGVLPEQEQVERGELSDTVEPTDAQDTPFQNDGAPFQNDGAPFQNDGAPFQNDGAYSRPAGARSPFSIPIKSLLLLSGGEEEKEIWETKVAPQLESAGLHDIRATMRDAIESGWDAWQALELIDAWERRSIQRGDTRIYAWRIGALCWQFRNGKPGSKISMRESEEYQREVRAKQARKRIAKEQAKQQSAQVEQREEVSLKISELEQLHGEQLDALSDEQMQDLVNGMGVDARKYVLQHGYAKSRTMLLIAVSKHQEIGA